jgi:hypothetical protein
LSYLGNLIQKGYFVFQHMRRYRDVSVFLDAIKHTDGPLLLVVEQVVRIMNRFVPGKEIAVQRTTFSRNSPVDASEHSSGPAG